MNRLLILTLGFCFWASIVSAQGLPNSELVERLKINRSHFEDLDRGASLSDQARRTGKDVVVNRRIFETESLCSSCPAPEATNHPEVKRATHESNVVATGHFIRKISSLTANEAFVFTDYEFLIEDVWKSTNISTLQRPQRPGDEITVTLPGGTVESNGHKVSVSMSNRAPIQTGRTYLLYLRYLPDSRSYKPVSLDGLDITGPLVTSLKTTSRPPNKELLNNKVLFVQAMRASTNLAVQEETK